MDNPEITRRQLELLAEFDNFIDDYGSACGPVLSMMIRSYLELMQHDSGITDDGPLAKACYKLSAHLENLH
jgi:hypothetical protein